MSTDPTVTRVIARALSTGRDLDVGQTFQNEKWRIHRYRPSIKITDLENAGKRGKKVREITIYDLDYTRPAPPVDTMAEELVLHAKRGASYDRMLQAVKEMKEGLGIQYSLSTERGIDVLPGVTRKVQLEWKTDEYTFRLEATPLEFRVVSSYPMRHPQTGKPIGNQDTLYSSRKKVDAQRFYAWLVRKGNESEIKKTDLKTLRELWDHLKVGYDYH